MIEKINEPITVLSIYERLGARVMPAKIKWNGRVYKITKLGFHHKVKIGQTLNHIFSVTDGKMFFRLRLDTDTLHWFLEEVSDGLAS